LAFDIDKLLQTGLAHHQRGELDAAERHYRKVLTVSPRHGDALNLMGCLYAQTHRHDGAVDFLSRAIRAAPGNTEFRYNLAYSRQMASDFEGAKADYRAIMETDPAHTNTYLSLGEILVFDDEVDEATDIYQRVLAAPPSTPESRMAQAEAHCGMGIIHHKRDALAKARQSIEQALELNSENVRALASLGNVLRDMKDDAGSAEAFRRAVALAPKNNRLRTNYAISLVRQQRHEDALRELDTVLAADPRDGHAISAKAIVCWEMNRDDEFQRLVDFDRFVHIQKYEAAPEPFADQATFHTALADEIRHHPTIKNDRVSQSTMNGQQTGEILIDPPPAMDAFATMIDGAVADYVTAYPNASGTGLDWPKRWRFTAWGVILPAQGYQEAHNHPSGMVSGVYYIQVPSGFETRAGQDGWLEFGPTNDVLRCHREPRRKAVKPEAGAMCLFPSHYWHRTIPFNDPENRICIAFDAVPIS